MIYITVTEIMIAAVVAFASIIALFFFHFRLNTAINAIGKKSDETRRELSIYKVNHQSDIQIWDSQYKTTIKKLEQSFAERENHLINYYNRIIERIEKLEQHCGMTQTDEKQPAP